MVQEKLICRSKQHRSLHSAWKSLSRTKLNKAVALLWMLTQLSQSPRGCKALGWGWGAHLALGADVAQMRKGKCRI